MPTISFTNIGGLNQYTNPAIPRTGELTRAVNVTSDKFGAKKKRSGYITFLGTADGSAVNSLFSWTKADGSLFVYRASGSALYHSVGGTGAWTLSGNGTITAGNHVGYAVLNDTLIVGDGAGSTRHSTNGTSFTNTTLAPVSEHFEQFQNRIYASGTASSLFYSVTNDPTNWNLSGSSDSSSFEIPGAGKNAKIFKQNNALYATKTSGLMYRWDGFALSDLATELGPSSPYSVAQKEDFYFALNRLGIFGYGGEKPQLISNPVQPQIYNSSGSAITGTVFDTAPGATHLYDYYLAVGTITEDFTNNTISNCIIKYNFQKNEFTNYQLPENPTAMHSFKDNTGVQQFIFAGSGGQVYKFSGTATDDNGTAISSVMEFYTDAGRFDIEKNWRYVEMYFNPGCEAKVQVAFADTFRTTGLQWSDPGDCSTGICKLRLPSGARSHLLFVRISESSRNAPFEFYGGQVDFDAVPEK